VTDETAPASSDATTSAAPSPAPAARSTAKPRSKKKSMSRRSLGPNDVEFRFKGDPQRAMRGIPATDLTQAEVDRMVYRRTIPEPGGTGLRRGEAGFSEARAKTVRELMATGHFTKRS
jgi:hypothetical protein